MNKKQIINDLFKLSFPTMMAMVLQSVYDIVDMIWVGKISSSAVAGVTLFSTILWIFMFLNEVIGASSISMLSQNYGRKDYERTNRVAEQTITFKVFVAIIAGFLLFILLNPLLNFYTKDPEIIQAGMDYGKLRIYFLPVFFASYSIMTIFRCAGDSKTPFYIMLMATVMNIVLDPIFMFEEVPYIGTKGFEMGVEGAAVATVIATCFSFIVGMIIIFKGKGYIKLSVKGLLKLDYEIDIKLLKIGFANGLTMLSRFIFSALIIKFVTVYGDDAISAMGVGTKIYGFVLFPVNGLLMGGSVIAGQQLGDNQIEDARSSAKVTAAFSAIFMVVFCAAIMIYSREVIGIFTKDEPVVELGAKFLRYATLMMPLLGYGFGLSIIFYGSGYNLPMIVSGVVSQWVIQFPFLVLVVFILKLPIEFLFASYMAADLGDFIVRTTYYRRGEWMYTRVR